VAEPVALGALLASLGWVLVVLLSLTIEQKKKDFEQRLCHRCQKPGHQIKQCPLNKSKGGKVAAVNGGAPQDDEMSEEDF
jgi:hypothetical protein